MLEVLADDVELARRPLVAGDHVDDIQPNWATV
jgi:hypothetical protein